MKVLSRILLLFAFVLPGCVATTSNYAPPDLAPDSTGIIAGDIAQVVADNNPAKNTRFIVQKDNFGQELSQDLLQLGYEVVVWNTSSEKPKDGEEIRYTLDWASPETLYIALTVSNSQRYTRTYTVDQGRLVPNQKIIGVRDE